MTRPYIVVALILPWVLLPCFHSLAQAENRAPKGTSRDMNPAISVNTILLYSSGLSEEHQHEEDGETGHTHGATGDGFAIQESELQLTSSVDAYARADIILAMHGTEGIELEEGILETTFLPRGFGLRAGKFYVDFGKHNALHTHQFPFVEKPVAWAELFGGEGLNGAAIEGSWLTPLPWYAEVTGTAFPLIDVIYGGTEIPENKWGGGGRLRQLWEPSLRSTFDLGISYAGGEHETEDGHRHLIGLDGTWKWTGPGANPMYFEFQGEWVRRVDDRSAGTIEEDGFFVHGLTRLSRRFRAGARFDLYSPTENEHDVSDTAENVSTTTLSLAFVPSEFQAWRVEYLFRDDGHQSDHGVRAQANFTMGSHPAHRY